MIQIWTALITILVLKALKAMAKFGWHLSNLVAFIRLNLFVKIDLQLWLDKPLMNHQKMNTQLYRGLYFKSETKVNGKLNTINKGIFTNKTFRDTIAL
ncbi:hypothetical protein BH20BAC1_BH20BAC1_28790 [soil metagenome]